MSKYFILLILLISVSASSTEFGIIVGGGLGQAYGSKDQAEGYDIDIKSYPIFRTGLFADHKITSKLSFIQEVLYAPKGSRQSISVKEQPVQFDLTYDLHYLEVPFMIKYSLLDLGRFKIKSLVGFSFSYLISAYYNIDGNVQIGSGENTSLIPLKDSYKIKNLDEFDYSLLYGFSTNLEDFGIDLGIEYRFSLSWYKINFPTYQDMEPVVLSNQNHVLTLSYKFWK